MHHTHLLHWGPCPEGKALNPVTLPARTPLYKVRGRLCRAGVHLYVSQADGDFTHRYLEWGLHIPIKHQKSLGEAYDFRNHVHSPHFCIWKSSRQTVCCTDRQSAVPAREESAQHPLCTLAAWDKDTQTLIQPQHRTW